MAEIFEIDDIPTAASSGADTAKEKTIVNDKHVPNFEFGAYPDVDPDQSHSPRIVDEIW